MELPGVRCMVGYVWYLFKTIVLGTLSATVGQLMKFGFVLLLTYMMGQGIFYMWENNIQIATTPLESPRIPSISRGSANSPRRSGSYPFVVEIPVKKDANGPGSAPKTTEPEVVANVELPPTDSFVARNIKRDSAKRDSVNRESLTEKLETDANVTATAEENENAEADNPPSKD